MPRPSLPPGVDPEEFVFALYSGSLHATRVLSLANAVVGVLESSSLAIHAIGRGLAAAQGLIHKHAIKQVDRLLSNPGIDVDHFFSLWVPHALADCDDIWVNMDWTDFDDSDHTMLVLGLQTSHGRSVPLMWRTHFKSALKGQRNRFEDELLLDFRDFVPDEARVTIVADRGFSDQKLYDFLTTQLGFEYVIRFRQNVHVTSKDGETRKAKDWVGPRGRMRTLRAAQVTAKKHLVSKVICVKDRQMKDAWCVATSRRELTGRQIKQGYGKRFSIEETFRDVKNGRMGLGLSNVKMARADRRDRLMLLATLAHAILTELGQAGEDIGYDRYLKSNTSKRRQHSLFKQGMMWYEQLLSMPEARLKPLMERFGARIRAHPFFSASLGLI